MQPDHDIAVIEPRSETLLERAVRRELARLDRIEPQQDRHRAENRPGPTGRIQDRAQRS